MNNQAIRGQVQKGGNIYEENGWEAHTTHAKTTAMAKAGPPVPSWRPIEAARAVTVAEWDEGIPPELSILLESHLFSLYLSN